MKPNTIIALVSLLFAAIIGNGGTVLADNTPGVLGSGGISFTLSSEDVVVERNLKWGEDDDEDGSDCEEEDSSFYIAGSGKRTCAAHYSAKPSLCSTNYIMKKKCQITCGFCTQSCEDTSGSFFLNGKKRFCSSAIKVPSLCKISSFEKKCPKACGECAPTPSPTVACEDSTGFIKINNKKRFCTASNQKFCTKIKFRSLCPDLCGDCVKPTPSPTSPPTAAPTASPTLSTTGSSSSFSSTGSSGSSSTSSSTSST